MPAESSGPPDRVTAGGGSPVSAASLNAAPTLDVAGTRRLLAGQFVATTRAGVGAGEAGVRVAEEYAPGPGRHLLDGVSGLLPGGDARSHRGSQRVLDG